MLGLLFVLGSAAPAAEGAPPEPAPKVLRFAQRALPWYPDSTFEVVENTRVQTPSGAYRVVTVERKCASQSLSGRPTFLVDEAASLVWLGSVGQLPFKSAGVKSTGLQTFVGDFLPEALSRTRNMKVKSVEWGGGPHRPGALIPFHLVVDTGYGEYRWQAAVSSDGEYLVIGTNMPLDEDPVAYRRKLLSGSDLVMWDTSSASEQPLEIVEFSDLECPACRAKWPLVKGVVDEHGEAVRHGLVSFPLVMIHPWAFRAASASWCVDQQDSQLLIPLKETFYSYQREMEVSLVTPTAVDFVSGNGLDEAVFRSCYLRESSLSAVHRQMALGQQLAVQATPTYVVGGWLVQMPDASWFPDFVSRLLAGEEF
jgi:protein-disulfide isomerase